jgi:hypothetical protein
MKNCSKCGVDKDFSEFGVDKSRKENLRKGKKLIY